MSMYNLLFGENASADDLLKALGLTRDDVPRYRDCYIQDGHIVVLTRTGGGNRDDYEFENLQMTGVPGYLYDHDAEFDYTYAEFHYEIPKAKE